MKTDLGIPTSRISTELWFIIIIHKVFCVHSSHFHKIKTWKEEERYKPTNIYLFFRYFSPQDKQVTLFLQLIFYEILLLYI